MDNIYDVFAPECRMEDPMLECDESDLELYREKILGSDSHFAVRYKVDQVINEILQSYSEDKTANRLTLHAKKNILRQFYLDFPRSKVFINNIPCVKEQYLLMWLSQFSTYYHHSMENVYYLVIMLCTQASFFYSFRTLHTIYSIPSNDIYVVPVSDYPVISIKYSKGFLHVIFRKMFKYLNTVTTDVYTRFDTCFVITIELLKIKPGYLLLLGTSYGKDESTTLYWAKENNLIII